jgi:Mn-dependent DtxR family transcriptional regulator
MVTKRDLDILRYIYAVDGAEFKDMMIKFGVHPAILAKCLSRLAKGGYVERACRGYYEITEKGKEFIEGGLKEGSERERELFRPRR